MDSFNLLLSAIVIVVGLLIIGLVLGTNRKAKNAARNWLTVTGAIISTDIELQSSRGSGRTSSQYLKPKVSYSYQIEGKSYTGDRLDFAARAYLSEEKAKQRIQPYQPGTQATVHYDPSDPSKSVLEPTASGNGLVIVMGIAMILAGILFGSGVL